MKLQVLQHVPFEGLGAMAPWFERRGAKLNVTRFFEAPTIEALDPDVLVVLGGPMSVNDEQRYPWLVAEKQYVRQAIESGVRVLGVCLGAQLIASALGARVRPNATPEIGWLSVEGVADGSPFARGELYRVFQWHGETFDLPRGARLLASSDACAHQAFALGSSVLALQFHLETTRDIAAALVEHCRAELVPGPFVQSEAELTRADDAAFAQMHALLERVLDHFIDGADGMTGEAAPAIQEA